MMRVLIVEDESLIALSLAAELELAGHDILGPSSDASEALCLAADEHADLALINSALQGPMDADELARLLQLQCAVPTLLMSTLPSSTRADATAALGIITLPFDPADICETLQAVQTVMRGDRPVAESVPDALHLFN
jgi:DNA-binding NarL/FixJ family response regulator